MAAGAVCLRKSHDIIILSFCNIVKGQAKYHLKLINFVMFLSSVENFFNWLGVNSTLKKDILHIGKKATRKT